MGCELLSNFLYFCSRNNVNLIAKLLKVVVNCSQIFCTFAVETTHESYSGSEPRCELLSNFLYFCSRNNTFCCLHCSHWVVNCSQIFCTFAVETTVPAACPPVGCCELLSNFLYFCSRNNLSPYNYVVCCVVNCSQIFCTFAVETTIYNPPLASMLL